jgi:hypothetical protein
MQNEVRDISFLIGWAPLLPLHEAIQANYLGIAFAATPETEG